MIFNELDILYSEIDNIYAVKEFDAFRRGYNRREQEYQRKRELNDQSYFLFIFTRLEKRITDLSNDLIDGKNASLTNYKNKNAWRIIKKKKLELMERVSFFMQPGGTDYNLIYTYKKKRDEVAHGDFASGINIPTILSDMIRLYNDLDN